MAQSPALVWFRRDLRIDDNEALLDAAASGRPVIPVFVGDPGTVGAGGTGAAGCWWLHGSLDALDGSLEERGSRLLFRRGRAVDVLIDLVREVGAGSVAWNRHFSPQERAQEAELLAQLQALGVDTFEGAGQALWAPERVHTQSGTPFQVFTPFWRFCRTLPIKRPAGPLPDRLAAPAEWPKSEALGDWSLRPKLNWADGFSAAGTPGEPAALRRLDRFLADAVDRYAIGRDLPAVDGTSRLSAALHFGEIGPRRIWAALEAASSETGVMPRSRGAQVFFDEIGWREFAHHQLWHFPELASRPLRPQFDTFPWRSDARLQEAWREGQTGVPLVDAGMRQLWKTGWMHNRVRMVVASYFVKHLLQPWTAGAAWFMDTLVDADVANNSLGWQWSAGCGPDAAPYFRVFNPVLQGGKFDPTGDYVRRWVPELAQVPTRFIHQPWLAEPLELEAAGVRLGRDYPWPIVDPVEGRRRALDAYASWRSSLARDGGKGDAE